MSDKKLLISHIEAKSLLNLHRMQELSICASPNAVVNLACKDQETGISKEESDIIRSIEALFTISQPETKSNKKKSDIFDEEEKDEYSPINYDKIIERLEEMLNKNNNHGFANRCKFFVHNGISAFINGILIESQILTNDNLSQCVKITAIKIMKALLKLFDSLYLGEPKPPQSLSHDGRIIQQLFPLFKYDELFDLVLRALEDMLISRESIFPLIGIKNFYSIVQHLDPRKLGQFSNVLALLIFEHNKADFNDIFVKKDQLTLYPSFKQTTINQAIILNIPELIPKLLIQIE